MTDKKNSFFIILCTYNPNMQFFRTLIDSLRNQSYPYWQCVVVDDLSADEIFQEINHILQDDKRFTIERNKTRLGVFHNFEKGLCLLPDNSDFVCYCDQDDIWMPNKLIYILEQFNDSANILCHSDLQLIDKNDAVIHKSCFAYERRNIKNYSLQQLVMRNSVTGCALAFRSSLVSYLLPFPKQDFGNTAYYHDHWTALHAALHGRISTIMQPLISYRQHGQNIVGASSFSFLHFLPKLLTGKAKIFQRIVSLWKARQKLISDFLNSIQSQKLTIQQQSEVNILKKLMNANYLRICWLLFTIRRFLKKNSFC